MVNETDKAVIQNLPLSDSASAHAPFVYFEGAPTAGYVNGIIQIALEAMTLYRGSKGNLARERVIVAHLRMNVPAALALKKAIESALLLAQPPATGAKN